MKRRQQLKVLVVDDDEIAVLAVRRALRKLGVENAVEVAHDGQQALERLTEADRPPLLVLLDLNMPRMGGLELLDTLTEPARRDITILLLTTAETPERVAAAHAGKIAGVISKEDPLGSLDRILSALGPEIGVIRASG